MLNELISKEPSNEILISEDNSNHSDYDKREAIASTQIKVSKFNDDLKEDLTDFQRKYPAIKGKLKSEKITVDRINMMTAQ